MRNLEKCLNILCILILSTLITYMVYLDAKYYVNVTPKVEEVLNPYQLAYADCLGETEQYRGYNVREREMNVCLTKKGFGTK